MEQELFEDTRVLCEIVLDQKSKEDVGSYWLLGACPYKIIWLSELEMNVSTMLLTNKSITIALQSPSLRKFKVETGFQNVMILNGSNWDIIEMLDLAGYSLFPLSSPWSFVFASFAHLPTCESSPYKPFYLNVVEHHPPFKNRLIHPTSTISNVHIMDALRITECHRRSKFNLTHIDFNNMVIEVINYLLSTFVEGILFILAPLESGCLWQVNGWHEQDLWHACLVHNHNNKHSKWFWLIFLEVFMHWLFVMPWWLVRVLVTKWWRSQLKWVDRYYTHSIHGWLGAT